MDRYLAGEDIDLKVLIDDLEKAVARGSFYPVLAAACADRARHRPSCSRCITQAFPSPLEHELPPVTSAGRPAAGTADLRPGRPAGRRGGQDHDRPVRRPDLAGPGLLRHAAPGRDRARLRPLGLGRPRATRTTTSTSGSAR